MVEVCCVHGPHLLISLLQQLHLVRAQLLQSLHHVSALFIHLLLVFDLLEKHVVLAVEQADVFIDNHSFHRLELHETDSLVLLLFLLHGLQVDRVLGSIDALLLRKQVVKITAQEPRLLSRAVDQLWLRVSQLARRLAANLRCDDIWHLDSLIAVHAAGLDAEVFRAAHV